MPGRCVRGILLFAALTVSDQLTKYLAYRNLFLSGSEAYVLIPGALELRYLENRGAAFGMLQNRTLLFGVFALLIILLAGYVFLRCPAGRHYLPLRIAMTGLAAGALGNLIDRAARGYVIDFIYFRIINFPIFNVADICVTLSVALLVILILFFYRDEDLSWLGIRGRD